MTQIAFSEENLEQLFVVGFRITSASEDAELYTAVLYYEAARADRNRPLMNGGKFVFFKSTNDVDRAVALGDLAFRKYRPVKTDVAIVYDLQRANDLLERGGMDDSATVVNLLNELLDFAGAIPDKITADCLTVLRRAADHLTFSKDITVLVEGIISPARAALLELLGAIMLNAVVI